MDGEAGWGTTHGYIGLPPLARVMGLGRQQHLSLVADGFRCTVSDVTVYFKKLDLVMDEETYGSVNSFYSLGYTLGGDCGADLAATTRIRSGWINFQEIMSFLTSRAPPLEMKGRVYVSCVRSRMP